MTPGRPEPEVLPQESVNNNSLSTPMLVDPSKPTTSGHLSPGQAISQITVAYLA